MDERPDRNGPNATETEETPMNDSNPPGPGTAPTPEPAAGERRPAGPELRRTQTLAGAALLLAVLAAVSAPRNPEPGDFVDLGERFFPEFEDPAEAMSLEVIEFDEATAEAIPFRVQNENGLWTIPSHHDYPADGADRLAETAAGLLLLEKDDFRSGNVADHAALGVIDPIDESSSSLVGRGRRITVKASGDRILADLIVGHQVEDREGAYFVRLPGQKRVYVSQLGVEVSARFEDWIERDLLLLDRDRVDRALFDNYTINERSRRIERQDRVRLSKEEDDEWTADGIGADEEVDGFDVRQALRAADELEIVGVRPKPAGIAASLTGDAVRISNTDILSLQNRGYYLTNDGSLLSNEGEVQIDTDEGIRYTLRFGEVVYGRGQALTAGADPTDEAADGDAGETTEPAENRYLFVTAAFDESRFPEPPRPANRDYQDKPSDELTREDRENRDLAREWDRWEREVNEGREKEDLLTRRFAAWYYVISQDSFEDIKKTREDLIRDKT